MKEIFEKKANKKITITIYNKKKQCQQRRQLRQRRKKQAAEKNTGM